MTDSPLLSAPERFTPPSDRADVDRWLAEREAEIAADVTTNLRRIVADALDAWERSLVAAGDPATLDVIASGWTTYVQSELTEMLGGMYLAGSLSAFVGAEGAGLDVPMIRQERWTAVVNENAVTYQRAATNRLVGVGESLWGDVRAITVDGVASGTDTETIKAQIERATGFSEMRADTIARTETVAAYNGGEYDGAVALGEFGPVEKQWLAANDRRTRESHQAADGQVVAFDAKFVVGGVMMDRPHDPGAPAGEVVNCRCVLLMLYPGDTRPDGTVVGFKPGADVAVSIPEPEPTGVLREMDRDEFRDYWFELRESESGDWPRQQALQDRHRAALDDLETQPWYTADHSLARSRYTGGGYTPMNTGLRTGDWAAPEYETHVANLTDVFAQTPTRLPDDVEVLWRGVDSDTFAHALAPGDQFVDRGFVSTSQNISVSADFAGSIGHNSHANRAMFRITPSPEARARGVVPGHSGEEEWILPPGSEFAVRDIVEHRTANGGIHRIVDLEWL